MGLLDVPARTPVVTTAQPLTNVTISAFGTAVLPYSMSLDKSRIYGMGADGTKPYLSLDGGLTWTLVPGTSGNPATYQMLAVIETHMHELLVAIGNGNGITGEVWLSSGFKAWFDAGMPASGSNPGWSKVITASGVNSNFREGWWASMWGSLGIVSEYGTQRSAGTGSTAYGRQAWLTKDWGRTFTSILNLETITGGLNNTHVHSVVYDPWRRCAWMVHGDATQGLYRCDDLNSPTWTAVFSNVADGSGTLGQVTSLLPLPDALLLGTDGRPGGIARIALPSAPLPVAGQPLAMQTVVQTNWAGRNTVAQSMVRHRGEPGAPIICCLEFESGGGKPQVWASKDGVRFYKVWEGTTAVDFSGMKHLFGPTPQGKILGIYEGVAGGRFAVRADTFILPTDAGTLPAS